MRRLLWCLLLWGCGSTPTAQQPATHDGSCHDDTSYHAPDNGRRTLPDLRWSVNFHGMDTAKEVPLSVQEAVDLMMEASLDSERSWAFYAFDVDQLYFVIGEAPDLYVSTIYVVPRDRSAEQLLEVTQEIAFWTDGIDGIRGGMTIESLRAHLGQPSSVETMQPAEWYTYHYPRARVLVIGCWVMALL